MYIIYGVLCTKLPTVCYISLLHILFAINTVKTISPFSAAAEYDERKEWKGEGKGCVMSLTSGY